MLKRCGILLSAKCNAYVRPAGTVALVMKLPLMGGHIAPGDGKCLQNFQRSAAKRNQEEFDNLL
eukprot:2211874-Pyramimonas_sp.AAC.1